jgi:tellurite resistance protein TerC
VSLKNALKWVVFWFSIAMAFNTGVYFFKGTEKALEFFGGYIIELSLSMDNLFVFLLVFSCYGIPAAYQRRVLTYGIAGAVILRLIFIVLGVAVVDMFHWVLYIFGLILIFSGIKMFGKNDECQDFSESRVLRLLGRVLPNTNELHGERFFVREKGILYATPLFAILVLIEASDIMFAIDSIPAIFSLTTDPFIVYSSNIFAILGLRNLYFVLERMHSAFCYVKYGVGLILVFTGIKLSVLFFHIEISLVTSIIVIVSTLALSIIISILYPDKRGLDCKIN